MDQITVLLNQIRSFPLTSYLLHSMELLFGYSIFTRKLKRKNHFALRVIISGLTIPLMMMTAAWAVSESVPMLSNLLMFLISIALVPFCFSCDLWGTLVCATTTVVTQNLAYCLAAVPAAALGLNPVGISLPVILVEAPIFFAVHYVCYRLDKRKSIGQDNLTVERIPIVTTLVFLLTIIYVVQYDKQEYPATYDFFIWKFLFIACDILALFTIFFLYDLMRLKQFNLVQEQLILKQQKQYELSKSSIEIVNYKCHDLKHQIKAIRNMSPEDRDASLRELEDAVMIYESTAKTGNQALDVIITEKALLCEKYKIKFTYIVDGEKLNFLRPVDIYVLFGNAFDNAIKACSETEDPEKRIINLSARASDSLLQIHMENYMEEPLLFEDGLPVTTQEDGTVHGFGLRSMRHICETYGGMLHVSQKKNLLCLDMTIPIPKAENS